jgi:COP9 signalosome complex subunit 3
MMTLQLPPIPKYMPPGLTRAIKNSPYAVFEKNYPSRTPISDKDARIFQADGNLGLVQQAMERAVRWRMKELTNTYVALGLDEMCDMVTISLDDGRAILLSMVT